MRERSATEETYWQERGNGEFVLRVDGEQRGIANTNTNQGVILSTSREPGHKFTAPDSQVIFEEVEKRTGITPVNEFRTAHGTKTLIPWRNMAEHRADSFVSQCPPEKEAEHYAAAAWHVLNEGATVDALTTKASNARQHLGQALTGLKSGQWSEQVRQHVKAARDLLRETSEPEPHLFQPTALLKCEKALAVIDRDQREQDTPVKDDLTERVKARLQRQKGQREGRAKDHGRERD